MTVFQNRRKCIKKERLRGLEKERIDKSIK